MSCKSLYLHIPFCERKCPYCDFYSVAADDSAMDVYLAALLRAIERQPFDIPRLETIYLGGGTPTIFGARRLALLLEAVRSRFSVTPDAEITVECNPHSSLEPTLAALYASGVNRLSFGVQSADDAQLRLLGRLHTVGDVISAVETAQRTGFSHISLDLMLATPKQTHGDITKAVELCATLGAEHVSAYLLSVEPRTPFGRFDVTRLCPDEDAQADSYLHTVNTLAVHGYEQYEISSFARDGHVSRHNLKYWDCGEYLGIGPAAHSFAGGRRRFFDRDLPGFISAENPWTLLRDDGEGGSAEEYIMLRARLTDGIVWADFAPRYPDYDTARLRANAAPLVSGELAVIDARGLRLTVNGLLVSNSAIAALLQ